VRSAGADSFLLEVNRSELFVEEAYKGGRHQGMPKQTCGAPDSANGGDGREKLDCMGGV